MNILIPMAGGGTRFQRAGFTDSKPLIDVLGLPMIVRVIDNIGNLGKFVFILRKDAHDCDRLTALLKAIKPDCVIVYTDHLTRGAAETCLLAKEHIIDDSLLIANCDQIQDWSPSIFKKFVDSNDNDGVIVTFRSTDKNNSYAEITGTRRVIRVAEKQVISIHATTGVYFWRSGREFVRDAESMISKNITTNNEFYVCPVYNETIANGGKIDAFWIDKHWPIGTPEDLEIYVKNHENL